MNYSGTLLPQTNDPEQIQKAILDLLSKINQVSTSADATASGREPFPKSTPTTTIGYFTAVDVAIGASVTFPITGTYEWFVTTYGATYNSVKAGITTGNSITGTASANLVMFYKRIA